MTTPAIRIQALTKSFGRAEVLHGVNLEVEKGETYGFLGPNGAGKTTTISCLMDFIRPTSGAIAILGLDAQRDSAELKKCIGYLPADPQLYANLTGQQHLELATSILGSPIAEAIDLARDLDLPLGVKSKHLSTGNKQKLGIIMSLIGQPELLILDEPTKGLDPLLQDQLYALIADHRHRGGTTFISSHNLDEVQRICDRVGVIRSGHLVANESMDTLRNLSVHEITVEFAAPVSADQFKSPHTEIISHTPTRLVIHLHDGLTPLLALIAKHTVKDLEITHASLEEVFMRYYQHDTKATRSTK